MGTRQGERDIAVGLDLSDLKRIASQLACSSAGLGRALFVFVAGYFRIL